MKHRTLVFLAPCLALFTFCASAQAHPGPPPEPERPPVGSSVALAPELPEPSAPRLPVVLVKGGPAAGAALSTLIPGEKPRGLKVKVGQQCAETLGFGSSSPVVSPNGRAIAFNDIRKGASYRGELVVASLDDPKPKLIVETLTQHKGDLDVCVQMTGWSADGQRLLYHVGDDTFEEADKVEGLVKGFHLWERGAKPRHLAWLESADLLTPDGLAVLRVVVDEATKARVLHRVTLSDETSVVLATRDDPFAFGQLHIEGELLAFSSARTLEVAPLSNLKAAKVIVTRPFAEAQGPRLSPDLRHLAWQQMISERGIVASTLRVSPLTGAEPLSLGVLAGSPSSIKVEWFDDTRLLVCDEEGVRLVSLDGKREPLAGPGTCFVPRGAR